VDRRLRGPQSSSERGGEEKNPQPPPGKKRKFVLKSLTNFGQTIVIAVILLCEILQAPLSVSTPSYSAHNIVV
jgi:hypothetical protein